MTFLPLFGYYIIMKDLLVCGGVVSSHAFEKTQIGKTPGKMVTGYLPCEKEKGLGGFNFLGFD